ncbi:isoquinoline 1-oxidoreductase [Sphingomonas spermidinifaciens]|uniref:Isoquinoline 1-oxidoreductase n=1 Tax=Sphingomonas spermidinifaciens TaxID=1141889 RepID=A0A2A4B376_9SPHN|nr:molybdopterin cofactor-binding domain-containing protein [Sphingomonas spermidinifaciens]PCD02188.1 isoquinoline 1-oxidoreductase [Sphingomonas spermidinifaciens]
MTDTPPSDTPKRRFRLTRRRMILGSGLVGGALVVGYTAMNPMQVGGALLTAGGPDFDPGPFGPYIRIDADGGVAIVNPQQEMGQGIHAALAAMIAEELDADWDTVRVVDARVNFAAYGPQMTAGSHAVAYHWDKLRKTGAAARSMFVDAAALRWQVPRRLITVQNGVVSHPQSNRSASFAELLTDAARHAPPREPVLKRPEEFRLIGTDRVRRKDCGPKSTGRQVYTQDIQRPDMLVAMVAHSPRFGGMLKRFDDRDARRIKGVVDVFAIETGVAVLAQDTLAARRGRDALRIEWDDSAAERRSSPELTAWYRDIAVGRAVIDATSFETRGDIEQPQTGDRFETTIDFPYLAHAPMEPLDCVAQVRGWDVDIWSGSHLATLDQVQAALTARTIPGRVKLHVLPAGGSFGRRGLMSCDYLVECVRIARRTGHRPVKLMWTREDEMTGGYYRPMVHHQASIVLGADGLPSDWRHRIVAQRLIPVGDNPQNSEGVAGSPYFAAANTLDCRIASPELPVSVSFWRSVGHSHTAMAMEHIVDQLARRARRDPAEYRRALYQKAGATGRLRVLEALCTRAGWGKPLEDGWARGMALHDCFGTIVGQVAEVRLDSGRLVVRRVVAVVDCGIAVSPDQVAAQMEGGIGFGLSAALHGAITLKDGVVQEDNFDSYAPVRMDEMPLVETHILPSTRPPTGMGEPGVPPIAPAVANALFALTGTPTRSLPFGRQA